MPRANSHEKQHETEYTFTRAAIDLVNDLQVTSRVQVSISLYPSSQRGVFTIAVEAVDTATGDDGRVVARVQATYPDGRSLTMSAKLFQMCNSLAQMVEARLGKRHWGALAEE
jgi:hypothetical protein